MSQVMVMPDQTVQYHLKEGAIVAVAVVWVLMLGSVVLAAWILCGWRGAKRVDFDWKRMRAVFYCR
jgi:hypothetical protein